MEVHRSTSTSSRTRRLRIRGARRTAAAMAVLLAASACTSGVTGTDRAGARKIAGFDLASALQPFDACSDLLGYLRTEAAARVTAYGLPGLGGFSMGIVDQSFSSRSSPTTSAMASGAPAGEMAKSADVTSSGVSSGPSAAGTFSGTNTVEAGVDEPDVVKTDGNLLVTSVDGTVRVLDISSGTPVLRSTVAVQGYPMQLLLAGRRLLILGSAPDIAYPESSGSAENAGAGKVAGGIVPPSYGGARGSIVDVDLADPDAPKVVRQLLVDGTVATARVVGGIARIVVQSTPDGLDFVQPAGPNAEKRATDLNAEIVAESTIDDWLPSYRLLDGGGKEVASGPLSECSGVSRPPSFHGFSTTSILTVDLAQGLRPTKATAVLADGQRVYASKDNLYVAIGQWNDPATSDGSGAPVTTLAGTPERTSAPASAEVTSAIHQFTITGAEAAAYVATGTVRGDLPSDFSMSEHKGILRVATTSGNVWSMPIDANGTGGPATESRVTVLRRDGTALRQIGEVDGLGRGERIYGVRFVGDVGYVVTFRQTDPLYVVDLSRPDAPAVSGELKILGYSAYLHDLGGGKLLGIGQDATETGRRIGAQVSLFDVSNPSAPTRVAQYVLPNSWSQAESDYKAFLWWAPTKLLVLPLSLFDTNSGIPFNGALGLTVDGATITEKARISHPGQPACPSPPTPVPATEGSTPGFMPPICDTSLTFSAPIQRSVVAGTRLYTLSGTGVMASDLTTMGQTGWAPFS